MSVKIICALVVRICAIFVTITVLVTTKKIDSMELIKEDSIDHTFSGYILGKVIDKKCVGFNVHLGSRSGTLH